MIRRSMSALVLVAATFAPIASHARPIFHSSSNTAPADQPKGKMVKMTLKNRTAVPMDLLIEDKPITIAANGEYQLKALEGTHVYAAADHSVKVQVNRDLEGTTCSFR